MIACPWCGTNYMQFQSNCTNCGGPLRAADQVNTVSTPSAEPPLPPPAPRPISGKYAWRLLSSDGWAIAGSVVGLLGVIFGAVGTGLTLGIVTAFVGIPFVLLGVGLLGAGGAALIWRYQGAQKVVSVLRDGEAARGEIVEVRENYSVSVNGRHPWVIRYQFQANGAREEGAVTTLNAPAQQIQPGNAVSVLFLPSAPKWNSIYPHP